MTDALSSKHDFDPYCQCEDCKQVMYDYEYKMYCQNCGSLRSDCECVSGYDD